MVADAHENVGVVKREERERGLGTTSIVVARRNTKLHPMPALHTVDYFRTSRPKIGR